MPLSKNLNTYHDVARVLRTAKEHGGTLTYRLPTPGKAVMFRSRCYYYRTLLSKAARARAGNPPGFIPSTEWDDMLVTHEPGSKEVRITFRSVEGELLDEKGRPIEPVEVLRDIGGAEAILEAPISEPAASSPDEDQLLEEARRLFKERGGE